MHAVDMCDIIKTYVLPMLTKEKPIEYTEAAYCAYCADAVFYADNESKPRLACGLDEYRDNE